MNTAQAPIPSKKTDSLADGQRTAHRARAKTPTTTRGDTITDRFVRREAKPAQLIGAGQQRQKDDRMSGRQQPLRDSTKKSPILAGQGHEVLTGSTGTEDHAPRRVGTTPRHASVLKETRI